MRAAKRQGPAQRSRHGVETAALAGLLVIGAYLMAVAIGSTGHAWLGWFTLFPLFVAVRVQRPIGATLSGALWGLSLYVFLLLGVESAVAPAIRSSEIPISVLGLPQSLLVLTTIPAIYGFLASWLTRRIGYSPFVLGVGWIGVEFALAALGLRYGLLAGAQGDAWLFHVVGNLLGYVFVAFLAAYVSASLISVIDGVRVTSSPRPCVTGSPDRGKRLIPQTFSCFPLFAIPCSQPRAPPM